VFMTRLNDDSLSMIPDRVSIPEYNRSAIRTGIVHVGVGNFHRSHEAYYTDRLLRKGEKDWGICGICLMDRDLNMYNTLTNQDGLYSLVVKEADGSQVVSVIGSIVDCLYAPADPGAVISVMADPGVKIISLTITEGGYNFDAATGEFQYSDPGIQWDLHHPDRPRTIFGYLAAAFMLRKNQGSPGLTVLSCDNIQHNGLVCKEMVMAYIREGNPDLTVWIENHVTFPNCMVDRITPVTSESDKKDLKDNYGIEDGWPVICEPFIQWVIEDDFIQGRPDWETAGVQFVPKVDPYEKMKIRLLNAGHSLLGFTGTLCGHLTIDEAVKNPLIAGFLREFMDKEVSPVLEEMEGIDLISYKNSLVQRFTNPYIGDRLSRICSESSSKIPKFLLPTIWEQLEQQGPVPCSAFIIAAWCHYLELAGTEGHDWEIQDMMKKDLIKGAKFSNNEDPLAFLKIEPVFGKLVQSKRFVDTYLPFIENLRKNGIVETIRNLTIKH
jgi:mannitol 2-dehydrogenase